MAKSLLAMWETWVQSLDWEDPLEKDMATHSSILAQKIPWMEEAGGLQSIGGDELDTTERLHFISHTVLFQEVITPTPHLPVTNFPRPLTPLPINSHYPLVRLLLICDLDCSFTQSAQSGLPVKILSTGRIVIHHCSLKLFFIKIRCRTVQLPTYSADLL